MPKLRKYKETASEWWNSLSKREQEMYIDNHPASIYADKISSNKTSDPKVKQNRNSILEHLRTEGINSKTLNQSYDDLGSHTKSAIKAIQQVVPNTKGNAKSFHDEYLNSPRFKENDEYFAKKLLDKIKEEEDFFDKAMKQGKTNFAIATRKTINELKEKYRKLTGRETFRSHEESSYKEYAGSFPVSTFQSMLRDTDSFSNVKIEHLDQYSLEYVCTPKPVIELSDEFLKKMNLIARKTDHINSIYFNKADNKMHFTFTERSFN